MTDTTLTQAQSATSDLAAVAGAGPRERGFLIKVDNEYQLVDWRGNQFARPWQVERGVLGSTPAAHSQGATVSVNPSIGGSGGAISATDGTTTVNPMSALHLPAGTLTDLGAGAAAVGFTLTRLGPFRVQFDTAGIGDGISLAALNAGTIVYAAWVELIQRWTGADPDLCRLDVGAGGATWAAGDFWAITQTPVGANAGPVVDANNAPAALPRDVRGSMNLPMRLVTGPGALVAQTVTDVGASAGSADVYALVATPA